MSVVVTCLLVDAPGLPNQHDLPLRRVNRWLHAATYEIDSLDSTTQGLFTFIDERATFTHLVVFLSDILPPDWRKPESICEDPAFDIILGSSSQPTGAFAMSIGGLPVTSAAITKCSIAGRKAYLAVAGDEKAELLEQKVNLVRQSIIPPFQVVRDLGHARYFATTSLVRYENNLAVCKRFRIGFEHHYESEILGLSTCARLGIGPEILEVGPDWVVVEYLREFKPIVSMPWNSISIERCRAAFVALKRLHEAGCAHFDFNPTNVLVNEQGLVRLIDLEHVLPFRGTPPPFELAPVFTGQRFFEYGDVECLADEDPRRDQFQREEPKATYPTNWRPKVGLDYSNVMRPGTADRFLRMMRLAGATLNRGVGKGKRILADLFQ